MHFKLQIIYHNVLIHFVAFLLYCLCFFNFVSHTLPLNLPFVKPHCSFLPHFQLRFLHFQPRFLQSLVSHTTFSVACSNNGGSCS